MTRLIPIVVLITEDVLPALNAATDHNRTLLTGGTWPDLKRRNGWTDEAIVAGSILAQALGVPA